jgi:hypothetical protein
MMRPKLHNILGTSSSVEEQSDTQDGTSYLDAVQIKDSYRCYCECLHHTMKILFRKLDEREVEILTAVKTSNTLL